MVTLEERTDNVKRSRSIKAPKTWQETWDERESEEQKLGSEPAASNELN